MMNVVIKMFGAIQHIDTFARNRFSCQFKIKCLQFRWALTNAIEPRWRKFNTKILKSPFFIHFSVKWHMTVRWNVVEPSDVGSS